MALVSVNVQILLVDIFVAIAVQSGGDKLGLVCSVTRKYGAVLRTTVALVVVIEKPVNMGPAGADRLPPSPLKVTAPTCASARPAKVELAFMVMDEYAMIVPWKAEDVLRVAELPTCQKMFRACAPPVKMTCRPTCTVRVLAIWKTQTSFGPPFRVRSTEVMSYAPEGDT